MAHSLTRLLFHCVFSTKGRRALLRGPVGQRINAYMAGIAKAQGYHLVRAGGTADHRHLLLALKPDTNVADAMRLIKANSSKWLRQHYPECGGFGWQMGYAAFTVSPTAEAKVVRYIDGQEEHHKQMTFEEELIDLLDRSGVAYDVNRLRD